MSSKTVPAAAAQRPGVSLTCLLLSAACCCPLPVLPPPPPVSVAARVLIEQSTVSDKQLILLKSVHVNVCVCVWLGR